MIAYSISYSLLLVQFISHTYLDEYDYEMSDRCVHRFEDKPPPSRLHMLFGAVIGNEQLLMARHVC